MPIAGQPFDPRGSQRLRLWRTGTFSRLLLALSAASNDRTVRETASNGSRIHAVVGELLAAGMARHVAVDQERKARILAEPSHHALIAGDCKRCAALEHENVHARLALRL